MKMMGFKKKKVFELKLTFPNRSTFMASKKREGNRNNAFFMFPPVVSVIDVLYYMEEVENISSLRSSFQCSHLSE